MKCLLCRKNMDYLYKKIFNVSIYECKECGITYIDNKSETEKLKLIYDFDAYKENEGRLTKRLDKFADTIVSYKESGSVLEIGAGFGLFSSILLKKGNYELDVVEPFLSPKYLNKSEYKLYKYDFNRFIKHNTKKYDVVVMFDVIEHFVEPDLALKAIKRILKKDGILVLQTPNYESLMQRIVKTWSWWMIEDHKWIFSAKSLKRLLSNEGLTAEYLITYEDWNDIKTNVDGNFVNIKNAVIKKVYKGIFLSFFIPIYLLFRKLIWKAGYGGLIFNIVRKG